jgi:hypothetical protein
MNTAGLWLNRKQRFKPVHQPRNHRGCVGALIQIDGSDHHWFEDRAAPCRCSSTMPPVARCIYVSPIPSSKPNGLGVGGLAVAVLRYHQKKLTKVRA